MYNVCFKICQNIRRVRLFFVNKPVNFKGFRIGNFKNTLCKMNIYTLDFKELL